jgi:ABC-type antimicrobial peptide transport system permease subunit
VVLWLLAAFAATGLLLSAIGLYGAVSWAVQRRTREMGLRIVLGAPGRDVVGLVLKLPVMLAATGALLGLAGAFVLTRFAAALLFEVEPSDPRVLAAAALVLLVVALIAALIPAIRGARIQPARALRMD